MENNTKKTMQILSLITLLVIGVIIYLKFYINKNLEYVLNGKVQNFSAIEKIGAVSGLKSKIEKIKNLQKEIDSFYLDQENILKFIEAIENLAKDNQLELTIDNIDLDKSHLNDPVVKYGILNVNLKTVGQYSKIKQFLISLEKMHYLVDFNDVRVIKINADSKGNWSMSLALKVLTN